MEREGLKEKFENDMENNRNQGANAIKAFLVKNSQNTNTRNENNRKEIELENDEVISEQSLNIPFQKQANLNSYTVGGERRGFKRSSSSNIGSPSKRSRKFDDLVNFFGGSAGLLHNSSDILTTCLKNTTLQTRQRKGDMDQDITSSRFFREGRDKLGK